MDKREQRARRDRRRDGNRNTFQKEQEKETVKQQDSSVNTKKNGQNVEILNEKNSSKDKKIEDDPLRFANLKRETDDIAALKAKKPLKRQVFSNWSKYEEPLPSLDESQAVDFETLLHAPQSGSFRFKSEQQYDTGSFGQFGELFTPDAELLVAGLTALPFYKRLSIDKAMFLEDEISKMDSCAKANCVTYDKLSKSKVKPKITATDLFRVDQAEQYSVVDQATVPAVELGTSNSKPVFSVEESPETPSAECLQTKLPPHVAAGNIQPRVSSRERTPARENTPEMPSRDFHFGKPPPSSYSASGSLHSPVSSRESTPAADSESGVAPRDFHFQRAPPPSYTSGNLQSPFRSRENTPAKETASTVANQDISVSMPQLPVSRSGSDEQFTGREDTPDSAAQSVLEIESPQRVPNSHLTVTGVTSRADVPSENVSSKEGTPAREQLLTELSHQKDSTVRETSPAQEVVEKMPLVTEFASQEEKQSQSGVPFKERTPVREELPKERDTQKDRAEPTHRKFPNRNDTISEQNLEENGQISTESDSYSKKKGKADVRRQEGQQRGGGRHGRRKKGHQVLAQDGEQQQVEARDKHSDTTQPETEVVTAASPAVRADSSVIEEEPRPAVSGKKKPERPPPPVVPQQKQSPPPGPPLTETKPEAQNVAVPDASSDNQVQPPQKGTGQAKNAEPISTESRQGGRPDDDGLNFLMSLRGQKAGGVSEVEAAKSAASATVSRSAIEEDELKESQKPKPPPVIAAEKKEDLEDWLDSMLDD